MTAKSPKSTRPAKDATAATGEVETAMGEDRAATGGATAKAGRTPNTTRKPGQRAAVANGKAKAERKARTDTKQAKLIAMLEAKEGATIEEVATALGWQAHTVRGALYGALKKKLGLDIVSEKVEGRGRVYRIGS